MSRKSPTHDSILSGSGDACIASNSLPLAEKGLIPDIDLRKKDAKHTSSVNPTKILQNTFFDEALKNNFGRTIQKFQEETEVDVINNQQKPLLGRRSLTLNDMSPPRKRDRVQTKTESKVSNSNKYERNTLLRKQLIMSKLLSTLYYKLWRKKKIQSEELNEQINQLLVQKSFLNQMRDKESKKRDELSKITERQNREIAEYKIQLVKLKEEQDTYKISLHNMKNHYAEVQLELEKTEYVKNKLQKNNDEYLEHMHRINDELIKLKTENKDQKRKILYMNNVADQQDHNLKQLHKIAEELDVKLKEKVELVRNAIRRRDEAIEKEELTNHNFNMLEHNLKESKDIERKLRLEINQLKDFASDSEKRKILVTLENVDLKYKLEDVETLLRKANLQISTLEIQIKNKNQTLWTEIKIKLIKLIPWQSLFHLGIHFFPAICASISTEI